MGPAFQPVRRRSGPQTRRKRVGSDDPTCIGWLAELQYGVVKSARPARHEVLLAGFCAPLGILPFDSIAAETYGRVRAGLERTGTPIGPLDTLIASHALAVGVTLVTNNEREFRQVAGLLVENWLAQ
ncbi:MAG: type II toxin-antitoxin system VapC family toxin [Planctomycetota bacterium]